MRWVVKEEGLFENNGFDTLNKSETRIDRAQDAVDTVGGDDLFVRYP